MKINQFNYTPNGNFDFVDSDGKDVTGEVTLHFVKGETLNNFHHKFIKIPKELWGDREVYLTDSNGERVLFDEQLMQIYFTNNTKEKLEYVLFRKNIMCFGIFENNRVKENFQTLEKKLSFEGEFLCVKLANELEMPYFFEIHTKTKKNVVDFQKKDNYTYLLDLTSIDVDEIESIYLSDYKFQKQNHYCIYLNEEINDYTEYENPRLNTNGRMETFLNDPIIGQIGNNHFSIDHDFLLNDSFIEKYRNQKDQSFDIFSFINNKIVQLNYELPLNIVKLSNCFIFKDTLIIRGFRRVTGDVTKMVNTANVLPVNLKDVSEKCLKITFPRNISTIQIIKSTNKLRGPFSEIESNVNENIVNVIFDNIFDDLGRVNGTKYMHLFANISFEGEKTSKFYKLTLSNESEVNNRVLFDNKMSLEGGIGKYHQYLQIFKNEKEELLFLKGPLHNLVKATFGFSAQALDIVRQKDEYKITFQITNLLPNDFEVQFVRLINRNVLSPKENDFGIKIISKENELLIFESVIDLKHEYVPFYWDVFIVVGNDTLSLPIQLDRLSKNIKNIIDVDVFEKEIRTPQNTILYPYVTAGGSLAFTFRNIEPYENTVNFQKEIKAHKIYNMFKKHFDRKNIWIVFEKNSFGAHDNAFHFFKYMYENEKHTNTYYVIRKDSPEYKNLSNMQDKVLDYMSLKYFIYMFAARVFISSDTKFHAYNLQRRDSLLAKSMMTKKNVFLQHGMNGIKKVPVFHKKRGLLDLIIAPSDFERENINIKKWGYDDSEVVSTGYARWDSYTDKTSELPYHQIFMMPTWRKSMEGMTKEQFINTEFYREYQSFLKSPELKKVLTENNTRLAFFLHPYFKNYVELFDIDESFTDKYGYLDVDMGEEIMKSSMMVSDYSSVVWDMFYLEKPVIFYQFDQEDYLKSEGAYLNYEKDLFGDVVFNSKQVVDTIIKYVESGFVEETQYAQLRTKYMNFHDHHNSERIYRAILSKKKLLGIENRWTLSRRIARKLWKIKKKLFHYGSASK